MLRRILDERFGVRFTCLCAGTLRTLSPLVFTVDVNHGETIAPLDNIHVHSKIQHASQGGQYIIFS